MEEDFNPNPTMETAQSAALAGQAEQAAASAKQAQYYVENQEKNLAEAQLECEKTLNKIYHKLKQDCLIPNEEGRMEWKAIEDEKRILTDEGVNKAMQIMESYVNKETLLSNFDSDQIKQRMLQFSLAFNSNIYMKYEHYFRIPSLEECKEIMDNQIKTQVKSKKISIEMQGGSPDEEQIKAEIVAKFGESIEDEIDNIKRTRLNENLREYELLFTELVHIVDAIHNRAWKGEERGSLRRHFNISEVIGQQKQQQNTGGLFSWGKR